MTYKVYDDYLERHKHWQEISSKNIQLIDGNLVWLSSGAIVFTITVVGVFNPYSNFFLIWVVWLVFTASLILRLLSFVYGEKTAQAKMIIIGENFKNYQLGGQPYKHDIENDTSFQGVTKFLNRLSFWSFIIGIILFFSYASLASIYNATHTNNTGVQNMTNTNILSGQSQSTPQTAGEIRTNGNPGSAAPVERPVNTDSKPIPTSK